METPRRASSNRIILRQSSQFLSKFANHKMNVYCLHASKMQNILAEMSFNTERIFKQGVKFWRHLFLTWRVRVRNCRRRQLLRQDDEDRLQMSLPQQSAQSHHVLTNKVAARQNFAFPPAKQIRHTLFRRGEVRAGRRELSYYSAEPLRRLHIQTSTLQRDWAR